MIRPCGTYILIKARKIEKTTEGGIILPDELTEKEQAVETTGEVVAIGPCAFAGWSGCEVEGKTPAECWGIKVGDYIEHKRYDGKDSVVEGEENMRYVPDVCVLGVINE